MEEALPNPKARREGGLRTIPFIICKSIDRSAMPNCVFYLHGVEFI